MLKRKAMPSTGCGATALQGHVSGRSQRTHRDLL
jgi:hypothetical protein